MSTIFSHLSQPQPTRFQDVNVVLNRLLADVKAILLDQFVGMYLYGSLASGDFNPETSDIDFVVVTAAEPPADAIVALASMHARYAASEAKWARKLEGSYIPAKALRRFVLDDIPRPTLNEGQIY